MNRLEERHDGVLLKREREAKAIVKWMLKVVCRHICSKFGIFELGKLIWLREVSLNEWNGKIRDEREWGILEEAHLQ